MSITTEGARGPADAPRALDQVRRRTSVQALGAYRRCRSCFLVFATVSSSQSMFRAFSSSHCCFACRCLSSSSDSSDEMSAIAGTVPYCAVRRVAAQKKEKIPTGCEKTKTICVRNLGQGFRQVLLQKVSHLSVFVRGKCLKRPARNPSHAFSSSPRTSSSPSWWAVGCVIRERSVAYVSLSAGSGGSVAYASLSAGSGGGR